MSYEPARYLTVIETRSPVLCCKASCPPPRRFEVITDYARNRLLLTPRPEALGQPFAKDRSGLLTRIANGVATLNLVAPGSPAEAAGLKTGQEIAAVNGKPVGELGVAGLTALRTAAAGTPLSVTLKSGATLNLTLRDYY